MDGWMIMYALQTESMGFTYKTNHQNIKKNYAHEFRDYIGGMKSVKNKFKFNTPVNYAGNMKKQMPMFVFL